MYRDFQHTHREFCNRHRDHHTVSLLDNRSTLLRSTYRIVSQHLTIIPKNLLIKYINKVTIVFQEMHVMEGFGLSLLLQFFATQVLLHVVCHWRKIENFQRFGFWKIQGNFYHYIFDSTIYLLFSYVFSVSKQKEREGR